MGGDLSLARQEHQPGPDGRRDRDTAPELFPLVASQ
jgi:hypothetical protein